MKKLLIMVCIVNQLCGEGVYVRSCVPCHKNMPTSLQQMFMSYLAAYSSEKNIKTILKYYLHNPTRSLSSMSDLFIDTYGIKAPTQLSDEELEEAINSYWDRFKVFDKLK